MKKTLITASLALLASGVVCAAEQEKFDVNYTVTMDFAAADNAPNKVTAGSTYIPAVSPVQGVYVLNNVTLGASGKNNAQEVTMQNYTKEILLTANNVGSGATVTYTLTFTAVEDFTLSEIKLALLTHNSQGNVNSNAPKVNYTFSISSPAAPTLTTTSVKTGTDFALNFSTDSANQTYSSAPVYTFDGITKGSGAILTLTYDTPLSFESGNTYTMNMEMKRGSYATGFFVGLGGVQMKGVATVPEPATATLSLLVLAGLAARRRRK